jgi:hypothetical protein
MTEQEARTALEQNWWNHGNGNTRPEGQRFVVVGLCNEDDHNFWFYVARSYNGEPLPDDPEEWEVWGIDKEGRGRGPRWQYTPPRPDIPPSRYCAK